MYTITILNAVYFCMQYVGLASVVKGPTNQTTCFGASSLFDCVISDNCTITWLINGQDPGVWGVPYPGTTTLFPGVKSTLILPGNSSFSGVSVICHYDQIYSIPAFLTILGMLMPALQVYLIFLSVGPSSLPVLTSIPHNSTSTSISWRFEHVTSSALKYQLEIRNSSGLLLYNQSLSVTQLVYTIPDPCDRYDAAVTAIYGYPNLTCTQRGSVQLVGGENRYCLYFMAYERCV